MWSSISFCVFVGTSYCGSNLLFYVFFCILLSNTDNIFVRPREIITSLSLPKVCGRNLMLNNSGSAWPEIADMHDCACAKNSLQNGDQIPMFMYKEIKYSQNRLISKFIRVSAKISNSLNKPNRQYVLYLLCISQ